MIIKIDGHEFDGYIGSQTDEKLEIVLNTDTDFAVVSNILTTLKEIETVDAYGIVTTTYSNIAPVSLTRVGTHTFVIVIAIQKDEVGELKAEIATLNDTIDSMLVAMLEGEGETEDA